MEDSMRNLVIGSIFGLLFVFLIFSFIQVTGSSYGKDTTQLTSGYYDLSGINTSLTNIQGSAEAFRSSASKGSDSSGAFGLVTGFFNGVGAFFNIVFSMFGFIISLFQFVIVGTLDIIFANPIITSVSIATVIILALFGIFRFLKIGS